jgi:hypothetical protein
MKKLFTAALLCAGFAHAQTVVDFANATYGDGWAVQNDFTFNGKGIGLMPGGYFAANIVEPLVLSRVSGASFDLVSLALGDRVNEGNNQVRVDLMWFDLNDQGHGLSLGYMDDQPGLQTFTVNLTGVTRIVFSGHDDSLPYWMDREGAAGFGPLVVQAQGLDVPSPVPEPATYALLLAGLGLLYAGRRTWA